MMPARALLGVAMLVVTGGGMAAEQALGRLFFTPEQRARMDAARQQERDIRIEEDSSPPPASITLNGIVTRGDGTHTVWVNNKAREGGHAEHGVLVRGQGRQVGVTLPDARGTVPLKVGQSLDVTSGQVAEIYRRPVSAPTSVPQPPDTHATEQQGHARPAP